MGLQGMINDLLEKSDYATGVNLNDEVKHIDSKDHIGIGKLISAAENFGEKHKVAIAELKMLAKNLFPQYLVLLVLVVQASRL